jgi:hypothetical protein
MAFVIQRQENASLQGGFALRSGAVKIMRNGVRVISTGRCNTIPSEEVLHGDRGSEFVVG